MQPRNRGKPFFSQLPQSNAAEHLFPAVLERITGYGERGNAAATSGFFGSAQAAGRGHVNRAAPPAQSAILMEKRPQPVDFFPPVRQYHCHSGMLRRNKRRARLARRVFRYRPHQREEEELKAACQRTGAR